MHLWVVYAHILGALLFMLSHGASATVILRLRRERDPQTLRILLGLSGATIPAMYASLLLLIVAGAWAGMESGDFSNGQWWLWASVVVLVVILGAMYGTMTKVFAGLRKALGDSGAVSDQAGVDAALADPRPMVGMGIGLLGILVILWLMVLKPF